MDPVTRRILDAVENLRESAGIGESGNPRAAGRLAALIHEHQSGDNAKPLVILTGHQYLPERFSPGVLHPEDSLRMNMLQEAAASCGCYARPGLLSFSLEGHADFADDDTGEPDETYTGGFSIGHWGPGDAPALQDLSIAAPDIVAGFGLHDKAPVGRDPGNGEAPLRYYYAAMVIWSPELNAKLLARQDTQAQLSWINYFRDRRERISDAEYDTLRFIMAAGFGDFRSNRNARMNAVAEWIIAEEDISFFERLAPGVARSYLDRIDTDHWLRLIRFFGPEAAAAVFMGLLAGAGVAALERVIEILNSLSDAGDSSALLEAQLEVLPGYLAAALTDPQDRLSASGLSALLRLTKERYLPAPWAYELAHLVARHADREYIHRILAPAIRSDGRDSALGAALAAWCRDYLAALVAAPPGRPTDWRRRIPHDPGNEKAWKLLDAFLESPAEQVFECRLPEPQRTLLAAAIRDGGADLQVDTSDSSSDGMIRITKTEASFEQALRRWEEDRLLLAGIPQ